MCRRVLLSWSSGKDSAWALKTLREDPGNQVVGLLTSVSEAHGRVTMHSTRPEIVAAQARAAGLPVEFVKLPTPCPNAAYEAVMRKVVRAALARGVTHLAFGDLFLEDVRQYRTRQLEGSGAAPLFPLWHLSTDRLARELVDAGVETILTCVDLAKLPADFAGRRFDHALLDALPADVDPCGEHGEFHTCVVAGPMFNARLNVDVGPRVERDGFCFADLALRDSATRPDVGH
jgi:uncharacterized protein (TIGR00290 family)